MKVLYTNTHQPIELDDKPIGHGGEAAIYRVSHPTGMVAKTYIRPTPEKEAKLAWMIAHAPADPTMNANHVSIAWPHYVLQDAQRKFTGYAMPGVSGADELINIYNAVLRRKRYENFGWEYLHAVAFNVASTMANLHSFGHIVGDVNPRNILVKPDTRVTFIDTDSFQVMAEINGAKKVFRCPVGMPEFQAPEMLETDWHTSVRREENDNFSLAIFIFMLLMGGNHPYRGQWLAAGEKEYADRIREGLFPYGRRVSKVIAPPPGLSLKALHPRLQMLCWHCFEESHKNLSLRPSAQDWADALLEALRSPQTQPATKLKLPAKLAAGEQIALPPVTRRPPEPPRPRPRTRARRDEPQLSPAEQLRQAAAQAQAARTSITQNANAAAKANRPVVNAAVKLAQWYIKRAADEAAKNSGNSHFVYAPTVSFNPRAIMWVLLLAMALQVTGVVNWGALVDGIVALVRHLADG
ncbi:MAG TPA: protein kinase [Thermoflexales bacterium]|nr:protein kinase [Thermoflexales bacterium]HQW34942.1 protein kinase [Thermoflexales bacterium]